MSNIQELIIHQVIIMFIMMMLGFFLYKIKMISEEGLKTLSNIILYVLNPAVIVRAFMNSYGSNTLNRMLWALLISFLMFVVELVILKLIYGDKNDTVQYAISYSNAGFVGIPIVKAVLGNEYVVCVSMYIIFVTIYAWTRGIYLTSGDKKYVSIKKVLANSNSIAILIGLPILIFSIPIPSIIIDSLDAICDMNVGLTMIVIGTYLYGLNVRKLFKDSRTYLILIGRLLIVPIITILICQLFKTMEVNVYLTMVIELSTPVGISYVLMGKMFNKEGAYRAAIVGISTALSLFTIPLMVYIAQLFI